MNATNNLFRCTALALEVLQTIQQGHETIAPGEWPKGFAGNGAPARQNRQAACQALNLTYNADVSTLHMQVCWAVLTECIARTDTFELTIQNLRETNRIVNIPQLNQLQQDVITMRQDVTTMQTQLTAI